MGHGMKENVVADLQQKFQAAPASFLVSYCGCTCAELTSLRKQLRGSGATMKVVKNTLARRAISEHAGAKLSESMTGMSALVWSGNDPVAPAKVLSDFAKKKEGFDVKGAVFEGQVVDTKAVEAMASLPSREVLLGKLLGTINAPATQVVRLLNAPASSLVRLVEAWRVELEQKA